MNKLQKSSDRNRTGILLITGLILLIHGACIPSFQKDHFMNSFRKFMVKTEKYAPEYTDDDWEKSDSLFTKYVDIEYPRYKDLLTEGERVEIHEFIGKYAGLSLKYRSNELMETIIEGIRDTRDIIKGIKEVFDEDSLQEEDDDF